MRRSIDRTLRTGFVCGSQPSFPKRRFVNLGYDTASSVSSQSLNVTPMPDGLLSIVDSSGDLGSGCHAKHFRSLPLESRTASKNWAMVGRIPSRYSEMMSFQTPKFSLSSCLSSAHKFTSQIPARLKLQFRSSSSSRFADHGRPYQLSQRKNTVPRHGAARGDISSALGG